MVMRLSLLIERYNMITLIIGIVGHRLLVRLLVRIKLTHEYWAPVVPGPLPK